MAGGKESPRQKMVGLMYLVLMALLAMNVSKDILESFVTLNNGLEQAAAVYDIKNESLYADFNLAKSVNPKKVTPFHKKAMFIKEESQLLVEYIDKLKIELIKQVDGLEQSVADTMPLKDVSAKDNYDVPTAYMIGPVEDASAGEARALKQKLDSFKTELLSYLPEQIAENAHLGLHTDNKVNDEGIEQNWEIATFDHAPVAAAVTILSELQNEIKDAEFFAVNELFKQVSDDQIPFDTVAAKVFAESNYVVLGDEYRANIFLAGFSKTQNPDVFIGAYDSVSGGLSEITDSVLVEGGMGNYRLSTDKEGLHTYEGAIQMTMPSGESRSFPFKSEYMVARPNVVVSPTKMLVLYKGLDNPVDISVPGVSSANIRPSVTGGNQLVKQPDGSYKIKVAKNSPATVKVNVSAEMSDGTVRPMGGVDFMVKRLPKPYGKIGDIETSGALTANSLIAKQGIKAELSPSFAYRCKLTVKSFVVTGVVRGKSVEIKVFGNRWNKDATDLIKKCKGQKVSFSKITTVTPDDVTHIMSPILVKII